MAVLLFLLAGGWTLFSFAQDDIRYWVDEKGVKHYSDYHLIPESPAQKPEPLVSGLPDSSGKEDAPPLPDVQTPEGKQKPATFSNQLGMHFVLLKKGEFQMGSPKGEVGRNKGEFRRKVLLIRDFYIQTTEVTQGQWAAVMDGKKPSWFSGCDICPVEYVSYDDVMEFILKLNMTLPDGRYRLPTEAEWEYACRAGAQTRFTFGRCLEENANYDGSYPADGCPKGRYPERTAPVRTYPPNAWGLYDVHGNVWEWCSDWFAPYPEEFSVKNPAGPAEGTERVVRGGSWLNEESICRSAYRAKRPPAERSNAVGFRLCLDMSEP